MAMLALSAVAQSRPQLSTAAYAEVLRSRSACHSAREDAGDPRIVYEVESHPLRPPLFFGAGAVRPCTVSDKFELAATLTARVLLYQ